MEGYAMFDAPSDGISSLQFSKTRPELLLCSSWDKTVRLYDALGNSTKASFAMPSAVLDATFCGDTVAACGNVDGSVRIIHLDAPAGCGEGSSVSLAAAHSAGAKCVEFHQGLQLLLSASWDGTAGAWDVRQRQRVATVHLPAKCFSMTLNESKVVFATAERHILVFDVRKLGQPLQHGESSLKHQTRCVECFPTGDGYAVGSIEGRVALEYFDESDSMKNYAFKCHRSYDCVYPVNTIAFHQSFGTFATGGTDGFVNIWDGRNKKRLCQLPQFQTSIASLAFSIDGSLLAIASSYAYEEGEKDHPQDTIFIHKTMAHEVTPKSAPPPPPPPPPPPK
ncbi:budding uninhibited by benzimidazoles 3 [Pelagophyceae sp. CCMP2097]|nr:budding uninhibited by benzimidazoles 3 [Pelagophyceae sp. CCMP2097]